MAASAAPELIRLDQLPSDWKHTVSIDSLATSVEYERLQQALHECGGPVAYLSLYQAPDRQFAVAQFFCESHAERFRQSCDKRPLGGQRIEVKRFVARSSCATPAATPGYGHALEITASRAIEVLNHFVGFDGWSHELLEIQRATPTEGAGAAAAESPPAYRARVRVHVGGTCVVGVGMGGGEHSAPGEASQAPFGGAHGFAHGLAVTGQLKKAAVTNALKAALRKLAIISFPTSGKVVVRAIQPADDENAGAAPSGRTLKRSRGGLPTTTTPATATAMAAPPMVSAGGPLPLPPSPMRRPPDPMSHPRPGGAPAPHSTSHALTVD